MRVGLPERLQRHPIAFLFVLVGGLAVVNFGPPISTARGLSVLAAFTAVLLVMQRLGLLD